MNGMSVVQSGSYGAVANNWQIAETGDFNNDGKSDLVWQHTPSGTVAIWLMNGFQVQSSATVAAVGSTWTIQWVNSE